MRKTVFLASAILLGVLGQVPAAAVPTHLHCMQNANGGTHALARGVTLRAPHEALHKFHGNVHIGVFEQSGHHNPHSIVGDPTAPYSCG